MIKLTYVILYVPNLAEALAFYQAAFGLAVKHRHEGGQYAELDAGPITLALAEEGLMHELIPGGFAPARPAQPPPAVQLSFWVDDVHAAWNKAIAAGAVGLVAPEVKPWGFEVAFVRDLNGVLVEMCRKLSVPTGEVTQN